MLMGNFNFLRTWKDNIERNINDSIIIYKMELGIRQIVGEFRMHMHRLGILILI